MEWSRLFWMRMKRRALALLAGGTLVCLSGCDLLDPPVPPIETFSTSELVEELVSRGFGELDGLFGDDG